MTRPADQLLLNLALRDDAVLASFDGASDLPLNRDAPVTCVIGARGSGKSHLLQALCHDVIDSGGSALYLPEPANYAPDILERLEALDLVCIDCADDLLVVLDWQVALFHLLNAVKDSGKRVVLALRDAARLEEVALADLRSRLLAAHRVLCRPLDDAAKVRVLQARAQRRGYRLGDEVIGFIMKRVDRDMHSLCSLLDRLEVETLRKQRKVTVPLVRELMQA